MKTKPHHPAHPRQPRQHLHRRPPTDPLRRAAVERRLHTDFLALAFYPGMGNVRDRGRPPERTYAA